MKGVLIAVTAMVMLAAGCARQPNDIGSAPKPGVFESRAEKVAKNWRDAGLVSDAFVPMQELVQPPKDGFPNGELKIAFAAGWFTAETTLPTDAGKGVIRYPSKEIEVPLLSAAAAFASADKGDPPAGQPAIVVTEARRGTAHLRTSRGVAEVPVWLFTLKGITHPAVLVAVSPEAIKPLPTPPDPGAPDPAGNLVSAQDVVAVSGNTIDYRLGVGACDAAITGMVWESADIVVIGGTIRPPAPTQVCTAQLVLHPVKVTLKEPVGDRMILDAVSGAPVLLRQGTY